MRIFVLFAVKNVPLVFYKCGHILDKLPLDVREWICPSCNNLNMRDKNAALNILAVGQTVFACGSGTGGETTDLLSLAIQGRWLLCGKLPT